MTTPSSDDVNFARVPPELIRRARPAVGALLDRGARYRHRDWDALEPQMIEGTVQLWAGGASDKVELMVATEIQARPLGDVLTILYMAGERLKRWVGFLPILEDFAREHGCVALDAWCRSGLEDPLKGHGWRRRAVLMTKDLT